MVKKGTKKKNVALVFGITKDYTFALANVLFGLKKYNKKFWDDIIVYHDGVADYEQRAINEILPVSFIDLSKTEHFVDILESKIGTMEKYSVAAFYRYECLKLLDDYHKVIWNDVDILIQGDISGLLDYAKEKGLAFSIAKSNFVMGSSLKRLVKDYKMFVPLWNDGLMVLDDKLKNYQEIYEWCISATKKYEKELLWPDLAILNLMLQEFDIEPENIDPDKYVCLPTSKKAKEAAIVHAYGDRKFWNDLEYMKLYPIWMKDSIKWSKMAYKNVSSDIPLVSCVMSCYERYDYLEESINSLLAQSYPNFEIIVVLEKAKNQAKIAEFLTGFKDSRIKVIKNKEKLGFAASLNVGIDAAKGEFIARMDDDDVAMSRRFSMQVRYLSEHPKVGIVGGNMEVFGRNEGKFMTFKDYEAIKAMTLIGTPFMHPTVMMRKSYLDKNKLRYDPEYFTEDFELWSRAVYLFECANIPEVLTFYRSHEMQATGGGLDTNENKIHGSHKRIVKRQLLERLGLDLDDNGIELIQTRRNRIYEVADIEGAVKWRKEAVHKVLVANEERKAYDVRALEYVLNYGAPTEDGEMEIVEKKVLPIEPSLVKKGMRRLMRPILKPVYGRIFGRAEELMIAHDEELRFELQKQLDEIHEFNEKLKRKKKNGTE